MSRLLSSATYEETYTQQWPWGSYALPASLVLAGGGVESWTTTYNEDDVPDEPGLEEQALGSRRFVATADATADVTITHADGAPGTPAWLPDRQARAEWWVRHPDVVADSLAYVVVGEVRDGDGTPIEEIELYRDDAPVPGWSRVNIEWPAREDALFASIYVSHRWEGFTAGAPQLVAGDTIGLAAAMLVEDADWNRGFFDGFTPNGDGVAYFDEGTYIEALVTRSYVAEPDLIIDYAYSRNAPTIVHDLLGTGEPDVTFRPVGTRSGTLNMFCFTRDQALAVENVNRQAGSIYLDAFDEDEAASMSYVVTGLITVTWDAEHDRWTVAVPYRETAA